MIIKINNYNYKIIEVEDFNYNTFQGEIDYFRGTIKILSCLDYHRKKVALTHELTHAFLQTHAHDQSEKFTNEQVCEMVANFGFRIVNKN